MKAFEEWFKAYHDGRMATVRGTATDTWQAALEWVLSRRGHMTTGFNTEYLDTSVIEQELEDE